MGSFRLPPTRNPDKGFIEESEGVGTPGTPYPASYTDPNPNQEAPFSSNRQVPYRGAEPHGVALTDDLSAGNTNVHLQGVMEPYLPGEEGKATQEVQPTSGYEFEHSVPVRIVTGAPEIALRKRFTTVTFTFNVGVGSQRVLAYRPNRTKARIFVKALPTGGPADRVWIGNDEGFPMTVGQPVAPSFIPLDPGDPIFETNTTDDLWIGIDPAGTKGAMVCVYSEWEVEALTEKEGASEGKKHAKRS